jgi:hypothetical protein
VQLTVLWWIGAADDPGAADAAKAGRFHGVIVRASGRSSTPQRINGAIPAFRQRQ